MTSPAIVVTAEAVIEQLGEAYGLYNKDDWNCYLALLQSVQRPEDVALHVQQRNSGGWIVTVCTSDCVGALSIISGMFAAHRLDITKADIFTLDFSPACQLPRPQVGRRRRLARSKLTTPVAPGRRLLDVLEVHTRSNADPPLWDQFQVDLTYLVGLLVKDEQAKALEQITRRISTIVEAANGQESQLFPLSIELDNELSPRYTLLTLRSPDTPGFLFAFSNALAILKINIGHAEIRTIDGEVQDKFWLTDRGGRKIIREDQLHELRVVAALIKHFTYLLPRSSNPTQALLQFNALAHQMLARADWTDDLRNLESPAVLATLADLMGVSQFLWEDFLRMQHQNLFPVVVDIPSLNQGKSLEQLHGVLEEQVGGLHEHDDQVRELNRFKDREMFRIDLRHITGRIGFNEFSEELSDLAQVVVGETAQLAHQELGLRFGFPTLQDGQRCPWCICALGKFGGRELGFGSDIEMIVVYQVEGTTTGPTVIENSRYFGDFVRECLRILSTRREGIFEVDLRLRPYGSDGPLASTLKGFKDYYSPEGEARQFERMALVKLRPVAGDGELSAQVVEIRDASIYSGMALDLDNILHLRHRQASELVRSGMISAKYSLGGLLDVEYFVQAWQIAVGCLDTNVRVSNTLEAIAQLYKSGKMPQALAQQLAETYGFSRRLIDALRVVRGHAKDLTIPDTDSREFVYLTRRLQYDSTHQLQEAIESQMGIAHNLWERGIPVG